MSGTTKPVSFRAAMVALFLCTGCICPPVSHLPKGYSSSYHQALRDQEAMLGTTPYTAKSDRNDLTGVFYPDKLAYEPVTDPAPRIATTRKAEDPFGL